MKKKTYKVFNATAHVADELYPYEDYVLCAKCKKPVGIHSMWLDTNDKKQKHYECLSAQRIKELLTTKPE